MPKIPRHKVFISRHHKNDQIYKDMLVETLKDGLVDKSVDDDDINDTNIKIPTIRQKIRDGFIADSTVTIVLIGPETHARKHIDWEISYTLRENKKKSRGGVLGIILPNHPDYGKRLRPELIPQRLLANSEGDDPYVRIYDWPADGNLRPVLKWIHTAFLRRKGAPPVNSQKQFKNNRKPRVPKPVVKSRARRNRRERPIVR